jgi:AraC-like DNA-binding protein
VIEAERSSTGRRYPLGVAVQQNAAGRLTDWDNCFTFRDIGYAELADLIRSACLTHYAEVARSVGLEPLAMLRKARLPPASLDQQDLRIPVSGVRRLMEMSATESGVAEFGLRMAELGGLPNLGLVALVVREQATLGAALEALSRYIHIHNEAMRLSIQHQGDVVILLPALRGERRRPPRQSTEWALGLVYRIISSLFGSDWRPLEVHFAHSAPANRGYYWHFFGCDVIFDSDVDAILCAASDMERAIPTADPMMARYVQSSMEAVDQRSENWDDKVSELVRTLLPDGHCTIERVAEHFGVDRRTIHRHLQERGTSFSQILDTQRANLIERLIEDSNRPLAGIAELLGFSAQSAMARWFRARFGCSITQWRRGIRPKELAAGSPRGTVSQRRPASKPKRRIIGSRRPKKRAR